MSYKAVIFDLDGTLLNTLEDLTDSTNFALEKCGFPKRNINEIRHFVGNGIRLLIDRAVPDNAEPELTEKCFEIFCEHYKTNLNNKTKPYDGIYELLKTLKENGIKTAIVTNKADFAANTLCGELFGDYIDITVGATDKRPNKPAPDNVLYALTKLGVKKQDSVFVGDSEVDIQTALNADIDCIGVLWGFRERFELEKFPVKYFAENTDELQKFILF
ncbi:MAG: HAD family hydrolase [Ruminococcaceae bacterium]|nr:HAD family hydrolase [Oscillospiraceae bacterium]